MRGLAKKRKFEREFGEREVFLESALNTFFMTYIIGRIVGKNTSTTNRRAITGFMGSSLKWFYISYLTSMITASLSMGKVLKVII